MRGERKHTILLRTTQERKSINECVSKRVYPPLQNTDVLRMVRGLAVDDFYDWSVIRRSCLSKNPIFAILLTPTVIPVSTRAWAIMRQWEPDRVSLHPRRMFRAIW